MYDEYIALVKNGTWILVSRPADANMVRSLWLFKHKFHADGTLSHYNARLVANDSSQQLGVDFDETFSLVVKPATIRTVHSLVVSRKWPIYQLDVKNAFLNVDLSKTVYMHQPPGFDTALGLDFLIVIVIPHCLSLHKAHRFILSQKKYALDFLAHAHMVNCNPSRTPVDSETKLGLNGVPVQDSTLYRSDNLLSWSAKRQHTISRSSAKAKYRGVANVVAETAWLLNILRELHSPLFTASLVYYDNVSAVYMSANLVQHQRTKHIEIDIHFVRDMVKAGHVRVLHIPSHFQYADIFTKGLPSALFEDFRSSMSVHPPPAQTVAAY
ncbi:ribonuclease H-like domain-containing protein [Tanacetum coccineum]